MNVDFCVYLCSDVYMYTKTLKNSRLMGEYSHSSLQLLMTDFSHVTLELI